MFHEMLKSNDSFRPSKHQTDIVMYNVINSGNSGVDLSVFEKGDFERRYLQRYLDEYVFRFNRRTTTVVGKRFYRIAQQAVLSGPLPLKELLAGPPKLGLANQVHEFIDNGG